MTQRLKSFAHLQPQTIQPNEHHALFVDEAEFSGFSTVLRLHHSKCMSTWTDPVSTAWVKIQTWELWVCLCVCVNHISVCTVGILTTAKMLLVPMQVCMCVCVHLICGISVCLQTLFCGLVSLGNVDITAVCWSPALISHSTYYTKLLLQTRIFLLVPVLYSPSIYHPSVTDILTFSHDTC